MKALLVAALLSFASFANAAVITVDEGVDTNISSTFVDIGQTHVDNSTGLEWLDFSNLSGGTNISTTMGYSINTALGAYGTSGFRLATETEVANLFALFYPSFDGGTNGKMVINGEDPTSPDILARNSWLLSFGTDASALDSGTTITGANGTTTVTIDSGFLSSRGMYADDLGNIQYAGILLDVENTATNIYGPDFTTGLNLTRDSAYGNLGVFMVRDYTVVPIPAAVWLFGSGLIGLVGVARRKGNV